MTRKNPIGIFDSGIGGLSVLREIRKQLPDESILYFADSSNCPYGSRNKQETAALARKRVEFLLDRGCKLIVIACNTVTAVAIDDFRSRYDIPFVGMEPALKPATRMTRTRKIGVLATENTFSGRLFRQTYEKYAKNVEVFAQPGYGLVELVEQGAQDSPEAEILLQKYLTPMLKRGADTLVLGCTHYPFLMDAIQRVTCDRMAVIDPADAVAVQTRRVLAGQALLAERGDSPGYHFYTTGQAQAARSILSTALDQPYELTEISD